MPDRGRLSRLKGRVSARLLSLPGVSGVGISGGSLVVYLEADDPGARRRALDIVAGEDAEASVTFSVTGAFRKQ